MLAFTISHKIRQASVVLAGLILFLLPIFVGVSGVLLPAAGYFPALGFNQFSFQPAMSFITAPGLGASIWLALKTGLIATILSKGWLDHARDSSTFGPEPRIKTDNSCTRQTPVAV